MKNSKFVFGTLLLVGGFMFILNLLTPEFIDDYWYKYKFVQDQLYTTDPITSFRDVLISQYNHYFSVNGRVVVHIIVQVFTGLWGKSIFNVFNAAVFAGFIYLLTRLVKKVTALNLLFVFAVVLLLFPAFGQTMLWMTGSVNYLWSATAVCAFLLAAEKLKDDTLRPKHVLYGFLCFFAGCTHEGIAFPLAVSLAVYLLMMRKSIFGKAIFPLIVGFVAGAVICTFSPATMARANGDNEVFFLPLMLKKINSGLTVCLKLRIFWLLLCVLAFKYLREARAARWSWLKAFYTENIIVFNAVVLSFGVIFASGYMSIRTGIGMEFFSLILLLRLLYEPGTVLRLVVCAAGGVLGVCILIFSVDNWRCCRAAFAQIEAGESEIIVFESKNYPKRISSYLVCPFFLAMETPMWNRLYTAYYHREKLAFIPEIIYNDILSDSETLRDIKKQKDYPWYVLPLEKDAEDIAPVFVLNPTDYEALPFYKRPFAKRLTRYNALEVTVGEYFVVDFEGGGFLFVVKNAMIDNRLKYIRQS